MGYLTEDNEKKSANRLNMLLVTLVSLPIPLSVAFHVAWTTIKGEVNWNTLSIFIAALAVFYLQIWYGKKINKSEENKEPNAK